MLPNGVAVAGAVDIFVLATRASELLRTSDKHFSDNATITMAVHAAKLITSKAFRSVKNIILGSSSKLGEAVLGG